MQSIWPCFQPSSVHYCSSESQTSTLRLSARVILAGGRSNTQTSKHTCTCTYACTHTHTHAQALSVYFSHHNTCTQSFSHSFLLSFSLPLSLTHTHNLTSPGIRSFYRAALCWRGRQYGRTASPSSDWISDQYPVPRRPASSGRIDCS